MSLPCRRIGPTTARSSRRSPTSTASRSTRRSPTPPARTRSTPPTSRRARAPRPTSSTSGSRWRSPTPSMFAPYKVATWDDIPAAYKDPNGTWVNDYGGYMSIGFDSAKVPPVTDGQRPAQAGVQGQGRAQRRPDAGRRRVLRRADGGAVARADRPTTSRRASSSSASSRRQATSCRSTRRRRPSSPARPRWSSTGTTSTRPRPRSCPRWQVVVPPDNAVAGYYYQAINKDAPHPAAAGCGRSSSTATRVRTCSPPGGVRPVRADTMMAAGTIDKTVAASVAGHRRSGHRPVARPDRRRPPSTWRTTGPRRSAERCVRTSCGRRCRCCRSWRSCVIFLVIPTVTVIVSAFYADGVFSLDADSGAVHRHRDGRTGQERAAVGQHGASSARYSARCWRG